MTSQSRFIGNEGGSTISTIRKTISANLGRCCADSEDLSGNYQLPSNTLPLDRDQLEI